MDLSYSSPTDSREERILINPFLVSDVDSEPELWRFQAACATTDPDLFYPERGDWVASEEAKKICLRCPVLVDCKIHALKNGERYGIWGGMSERERRLARRVHS
jgi:WhiB family redox-sensing transcriptional regulator